VHSSRPLPRSSELGPQLSLGINTTSHQASPNKTSSSATRVPGNTFLGSYNPASGTNSDCLNSSTDTKNDTVPPSLFSHDFKSLVKAKAAKDQRRVPVQVKQRDASVELHLERYRNSNGVGQPSPESRTYPQQHWRNETRDTEMALHVPQKEGLLPENCPKGDQTDWQTDSLFDPLSGPSSDRINTFDNDFVLPETEYGGFDSFQLTDSMLSYDSMPFGPHGTRPTSNPSLNRFDSDLASLDASFSIPSARTDKLTSPGKEVILTSACPDPIQALHESCASEAGSIRKEPYQNPLYPIASVRKQAEMEMTWDSNMNPKPRKRMRSRNTIERERISLVRKAGACERHRISKKKVSTLP
jgi:hypothetical protein